MERSRRCCRSARLIPNTREGDKIFSFTSTYIKVLRHLKHVIFLLRKEAVGPLIKPR